MTNPQYPDAKSIEINSQSGIPHPMGGEFGKTRKGRPMGDELLSGQKSYPAGSELEGKSKIYPTGREYEKSK